MTRPGLTITFEDGKTVELSLEELSEETLQGLGRDIAHATFDVLTARLQVVQFLGDLKEAGFPVEPGPRKGT